MASALSRICRLNLTTSRFCRSHEIPKGPLLRRLYYLFLQLSLDSSFRQYKFGDRFSMDIWNKYFVVNLKFEDMVRLSDMLFNEVRRQFGLLVSGMGFPPEMTSSTDNSQHSNIMIPFEDFALLLRCCMAILQLLEFDPSVVLEKCQILLTLLERLCSLDLIVHAASHKVQSGERIFCFKKSVSHECKYTLDDVAVSCIREELDASIHFAKQGGSSVALLCSILEDLVYRRSSRIVASNFQKIQTLHIRERRCLMYSTKGLATHALSLVEKPDGQVKFSQNTLDNSKDAEDDCEAEEDTDTVSGRDFLEDLGMSSDSVDDLADFVVCKRGKDYSSWMKMRLKYRKWKCGKMRVERERRARTMALESIKEAGSKRHRRM